MDHLLRQLDTDFPATERPRYQVAWSEAKIEALHRMANNEQPVRDPVEAALAPALLKCAAGDFEHAELDITALLRQDICRFQHHPQAFICLLQAVFVVQRFDLLSAMLMDRYEFGGELEVGAADGGLSPACVRWSISAPNKHRFIFDSRSFQDDGSTHRIAQLNSAFPMYANYASRPEHEIGSVTINQFDVGVHPGLAFCDSRPDYFLVPDLIFVATGGYRYARKIFRETEIPWQHRKPVAFWRGATTGPKSGPRNWRSLERIRLCEIARRYESTGLIDAGIAQVVQFVDPAVADEVKAAGLMKAFVRWQEWGQYKYHIDIDGNSSPFSNLFQRLLTGSAVLKVESPRGLIQWYYNLLVPWKNYVPIAPDLSDLIDKIRWLTSNDEVAKRIGENGLELAEQMTYDREVERSVPVISAAFRYFNGQTADAAPYGRDM